LTFDNKLPIEPQVAEWRKTKLSSLIGPNQIASPLDLSTTDSILTTLTHFIGDSFNATLYGFDIIVNVPSSSEMTTKAAIAYCIDVNYFPSYGGIAPEKFFSLVMDYYREKESKK